MATTAPDPRLDHAQDRIAATVAALQADLARSESKASLLLALAGAALVALGSMAPDLHPTTPAAVTGALGTAALLATTVILLLAVRPHVGGDDWTGWPALSDDQLGERLSSGYQVGQVRFMAELATHKFRLIRAAVDCLLAGLGLLALAAVLVAAA
ncbi:MULTISPECIES: Pycsar system effector family protein [unclassified Streptomyces]|uniref:Pycsar system effector family protein n=1 Tax=unclassified Streptomyces TaxID=2593676 RepID=UPI00336AD0E7